MTVARNIQVRATHEACVTTITKAWLLFIAGIARAHRVLVNVEDIPDLCNFHIPALIRRGELNIAISTSGTNPGFAAALRRELDTRFDASWTRHIQSANQLRARMRSDGSPPGDIIRAMERCVASGLGTGPFPS